MKTDDLRLFGSMLTWKLRHGSHEFPGPDGGTCINEAAIVAAGFPYHSVQSADDCPPCFSRPVSDYSIALNDLMPMKTRQRLLMPFVLRLAGTADTEAVERLREAFIVSATTKTIIPLAFPGCQFGDKVALADALKWMLNNALQRRNYLHAHWLDIAQKAVHQQPTLSACAHIALAISKITGQPAMVFRRAVDILDKAITLGKHQPLEPIVAEQHMRAIRQNMAEQRKNKRKQLADATA
jgi:hypothetical protein